MPKKSNSRRNSQSARHRQAGGSGKTSTARGGNATRGRTRPSTKSRDASESTESTRRGFPTLSPEERHRIAARDGQAPPPGRDGERDNSRREVGRADDALWRTEGGPRDDRRRDFDDRDRGLRGGLRPDFAQTRARHPQPRTKTRSPSS